MTQQTALSTSIVPKDWSPYIVVMIIKAPLVVLLLLLPLSVDASIQWLCDWFPDWNIPFVNCDRPQSPPVSPSPPTPPTPPTPTPPTPTPPTPSPPVPNSCNNPNPSTSTNSQFSFSFAFADVPAAHQNSFQSAARRWQRVVIGDLQDVTSIARGSTSRCGEWPSSVDDVVSILVHECVRTTKNERVCTLSFLFLATRTMNSHRLSVSF